MLNMRSSAFGSCCFRAGPAPPLPPPRAQLSFSQFPVTPVWLCSWPPSLLSVLGLPGVALPALVLPLTLTCCDRQRAFLCIPPST